jgi:hypothetical protein
MMTNVAHLPTREWTRTPAPKRGFVERPSRAERASIRLLGRDLRVPAGARLAFQGDVIDRVLILTSSHAQHVRSPECSDKVTISSGSASGASRDRTGDLLLAKPWLDAQNPVVTAILIGEHPCFMGFCVAFDAQSDAQKVDAQL